MSDLQLNREELAWCAGFLDGEGNFACMKNRGLGSTLRVQAAQCDPEVLYRLQRSLGGKVYGPYAPKTPNSQPYWQWNINRFEQVQQAICYVWPWLSPVKRAQASQALRDFRVYCEGRKVGRPIRIPDDQIPEIKRLWATGSYQQKELAGMFNTSASNISLIVRGKSRG